MKKKIVQNFSSSESQQFSIPNAQQIIFRFSLHVHSHWIRENWKNKKEKVKIFVTYPSTFFTVFILNIQSSLSLLYVRCISNLLRFPTLRLYMCGWNGSSVNDIYVYLYMTWWKNIIFNFCLLQFFHHWGCVISVQYLVWKTFSVISVSSWCEHVFQI